MTDGDTHFYKAYLDGLMNDDTYQMPHNWFWFVGSINEVALLNRYVGDFLP